MHCVGFHMTYGLEVAYCVTNIIIYRGNGIAELGIKARLRCVRLINCLGITVVAFLPNFLCQSLHSFRRSWWATTCLRENRGLNGAVFNVKNHPLLVFQVLNAFKIFVDFDRFLNVFARGYVLERRISF